MSGYEYSSRGENIKPIYRENYYVYDRGVSNHSSFSCKQWCWYSIQLFSLVKEIFIFIKDTKTNIHLLFCEKKRLLLENTNITFHIFMTICNDLSEARHKGQTAIEKNLKSLIHDSYNHNTERVNCHAFVWQQFDWSDYLYHLNYDF